MELKLEIPSLRRKEDALGYIQEFREYYDDIDDEIVQAYIIDVDKSINDNRAKYEDLLENEK